MDDHVLRTATEMLLDERYTLAHRIDAVLAHLRAAGETGTRRARVARAAAALLPQAAMPLVTRKMLRWACRALEERIVIEPEPEAQRWVKIVRAWTLLQEGMRRLLAEMGEDPDDPALRAAAAELTYQYVAAPRGAAAAGTEAETEADADDAGDTTQPDPFFVILDEMNLARVEYYLADVLSVLESGRLCEGPEAGFTRGESSLHSQPTEVRLSDGTLIPPRLRLPPNLHLVGTVNMDETTFAFSPKVLDRAFTLEFREVNLEGYPTELPPAAAGSPASVALPESPTPEEPAGTPAHGRPPAHAASDQAPAAPPLEAAALLADFTRQGRFAHLTKADIQAWGRSRRGLVRELQELSTALMPYDLGFGYRVVDEILAFVGGMAESPLAAALSEIDAFDAAVMMKVLPKFHGPLHRLEQPPQAVLAWAGEGEGLRYPRTRQKAVAAGYKMTQ